MQSRDGGWGAFDADNTRRAGDQAAVLRLRRGHRPAVGRRHRAHGGGAGRARAWAAPEAVRRGVAWLLRAQESDGSWFGRWGANYVYGTGAVVPALIAAGVQPGKPVIRRAVAWLVAPPEPRRRLGRGPALLRRPGAWSGRGESTASQTAWALLALLAGGGPAGPTSRAQRRARRPVAGRHPARRRHLGRAAVHRDRVPRRLLHQLPPVPAGVPGQRPGPLPGRPGDQGGDECCA